MPRLNKTYNLNFYDGEPLLCFPLIKKTVSFLNKKNKELNRRAKYSITTNGSLLTKEIIQFLGEYKFSVELSFDGLAQDIQRKKGSFKKIIPTIIELSNLPKIDLEINSVFTPETVGCISESMEFLLGLEISNINCSLSLIRPWDQDSLMELKNEMKKLRRILLDHYRRKGNIPIVNFREDPGKGIFYCAAGKDRLSLTPEEEIWGCYLFPEYFKGRKKSSEYRKFYFGTLDDFMKNHEKIYPRISANYAQLSMDNFCTSQTECFLCSELENCAVCPINASFSGRPLGKIPHYSCEIQKIRIREKEKFMKEL